MGFSPFGLAVGLAVLAPNLLLIWFPPTTPAPSARAPLAISWIERAGQAACLVVPAITAPGDVTRAWVIVVAVALVAYYALWVRYLVAGRALAALYQPVWAVPVPMAILPVTVFLSTAGWLGNPWIAVAATVLAVGHVPTALIIARAAAVEA